MEVEPIDAIRHGNFHQYYVFRHQDSRPQHLERCLPKCLKKLTNGIATNDIYMLDIGCNVGKLTHSIRKVMLSVLNEQKKTSFAVGVDIDAELVNKASATYNSEYLEFIQADLSAVAMEEIDDPIKKYMASKGIQRFDFISCFSVLMYIHLNRGDDGLKKVLDYVCSHARILILELQSWKKYRDHVHRMRRYGAGDYELYNGLKWRGSNGALEQSIGDYVISKGFSVICTTEEKNEFNRNLVIYASNDIK
ncbi:probable RNA methyltransferase CG11342 [Ochlerotatus camptorhynchus]|uniref:probable RNA methyltransferase CG11342 n=1 Tax=Ochlerotatus camptorhynchus TaxID=644619 RepID=UPI0031D547C7